jgi:hypothetical protein
MVEVTPEDKAAASRFIAANDGDYPELCELFAAHREAAEQAAAAKLERIQHERDQALREAHDQLAKARTPQWFYHPDYTERCEYGPWDVIEAYDLEPGKHVVEIQTARPLPSIWSVVHVLTDAEKDAMETDEAWVVQDFATEAEARATLASIERGDHLEEPQP